MPTREIEYEKEVTATKELTFCSDCGMDVDAKGNQFEGDEITLDFCSDCLDRYTEEDIDVLLAREKLGVWHEEKDGLGSKMLSNIRKIKLASRISVLFATLAFLLLLPSSQLATVLAMLCLIFTLFSVFVVSAYSSSLSEPEELVED